MPAVSGSILDINGNGVARVVRVYRRDTGAFIAETTSSAVDGSYSVTSIFAGEVSVIMLDDAIGSIENDQVLRTTPV